MTEADATYKPTARCPSCRRCPNVRFTAAEVQRSKLERQAARVVSVACPRCGTQYWIRAREIAEATLDDHAAKRDGLDARAAAHIA